VGYALCRCKILHELFRFRTKSISECMGNTFRIPDGPNVDASSSESANFDRVVLYASVSEPEKIHQAAAPFRRNGLLALTAQLGTLLLDACLDSISSYGVISNPIPLSIWILSISSSMSFLISTRYPTAYRFFLSYLIYSVAGFWTIYAGTLFGRTDSPLRTTIRLVSAFACVIMWFITHGLKECYSPQTFLMKQKE